MIGDSTAEVNATALGSNTTLAPVEIDGSKTDTVNACASGKA